MFWLANFSCLYSIGGIIVVGAVMGAILDFR
jgi:hypothetical protein